MAVPDSLLALKERRISGASIVALGALLIHVLLLAWMATVNSPNFDELGHLPAGLSHWKFGRFDLYRVNPPLVRTIAAVPVLFTDAKMDWSRGYVDSVYARSEFTAGKVLLEVNQGASFWYFTLARWALIPLSLAGGWTCYRWACDLYGPRAGMTAVMLFCFCPNMLGWGASITPDAGAASLGIVAGYAFWRWLNRPCLKSAVWAGVALGLAELTKTTWIVLYPLWPLLWWLWRIDLRWARAASGAGVDAGPDGPGDPSPQNVPGRVPGVATDAEGPQRGALAEGVRTQDPPAREMLAILCLAVYIVNIGYGFEGTFRPLGSYAFVSRALSGADRPVDGGNVFAESWIARLPIPFPENYVRGIDVQRFDFEQKKWSYLRGEQRKGGWWYYYLYCGLIKTPVGMLALFLSAVVVTAFSLRIRGGWRDQAVVWMPAIAVWLLVSSQTGFSRYYRYVIPALPFMYVAVSGVLRGTRGRVAPALVAVALFATVVESLAVVPHSMSFFNILVGGPLGGPAHVLDANIDWGQDLLCLKRWYDAHPEARPLHVSYFGGTDVDPRLAGIEFKPVPQIHLEGPAYPTPPDDTQLLRPGWYAVSVNHVRGYHHFENDKPVYTYFQQLRRVARAGYSIYIYHVTADEAAAINGQARAAP